MTRKRVVFLAVGLAAAGLIVVIGALAALVHVGISGFGKRAANDAERALLVSTAKFAPLGIDGLTETTPAVTTKRTLDGTREIEWEFGNEHFYILSGAEICASTRNAKESFKLTLGAWRTGMALGGGASVDEAPELLRGGDDRYAGHVVIAQKRVGNVFLVRNGRILHSLLITGIPLNEPSDVQRLFDPVVAESTRQYAR